MKILEKVKEMKEEINWGLIFVLIVSGVSVGVITFIIFLYLFAFFAHLQSAIGFARAFLVGR